MSKANRITVVSDRLTGKARTITASELRHIRKYAGRCKDRFPNFRLHLPFSAGDVNRIFFYLPAVKESDMAAPFSGFRSDAGADEGIIIKPTTSTVDAPPVKIKKPAAPRKKKVAVAA